MKFSNGFEQYGGIMYALANNRESCRWQLSYLWHSKTVWMPSLIGFNGNVEQLCLMFDHRSKRINEINARTQLTFAITRHEGATFTPKHKNHWCICSSCDSLASFFFSRLKNDPTSHTVIGSFILVVWPRVRARACVFAMATSCT